MDTTLRVGDWTINLKHGWLSARHGLLRRKIYPDCRVMSVLATLVANPGELISTDEILATAWPGRVVSRDSVSTAIYQLRQLLGDDSTAPTYIRTEPRRGYRFIAPVEAARRHSTTWRVAAAIASISVLVEFGIVMQFNPDGLATAKSPQLYVVPLENVTGDLKLKYLTVAMDATLFSALVRMNPSTVAARPGNEQSSLRLESQIVACDLGPTLVVRLLDVHRRHYLWSKSYLLYGDDLEPTVVEHIAREVTAVLVRT